MMDKNRFYQAVGDLDIEFLEEFEKIEKMENYTMKKKLNLVAVAACCVLLLGAGVSNILVREFTGGNLFEWHNEEKMGYSYHSNTTAEEVYEEREDGLYYIFQGAELEISAYCSETDYFLTPVLDENGTGYVVVIGGGKGERGFLLKHFEEGEFFIGHGNSEIYGYEISWKPEETTEITLGTKIQSSFPQLTWNHHATHFIDDTLSEEWFGNNLPETLSTELGVAKKIEENFFFVQGEKLGFYSPDEQGNWVKTELSYQYSKLRSETDRILLGSFGVTPPMDEKPLLVSLEKNLTDEEIAVIVKIIDEIGFPYVLEFID